MLLFSFTPLLSYISLIIVDEAIHVLPDRLKCNDCGLDAFSSKITCFLYTFIKIKLKYTVYYWFYCLHWGAINRRIFNQSHTCVMHHIMPVIKIPHFCKRWLLLWRRLIWISVKNASSWKLALRLANILSACVFIILCFIWVESKKNGLR